MESDSNVWFGVNATILDGVHAGDGVLIAAETMGNCDILGFEICGGVPAKRIKM